VHCPGWAGTSPSGWAGILSRVGRVAPALHPGQAGLFPSLPRLERLTRLGRDFQPRRGPLPRLGLRPPAPAGPLAGRPGWASSARSPSGPTSPQCPAAPDQEDPTWPGFIPGPPFSPRPAGPDQEDPAWPGFLPFGPPSGHCSGRARPGFPWPRLDYSSQGRFSPLRAGIYLLRDIFCIRHRFQCLVPVLGRPLAQTGTYSIVMLVLGRPLAQTSILFINCSQPYPQEEDKTND
jgi:hypothetical protein